MAEVAFALNEQKILRCLIEDSDLFWDIDNNYFVSSYGRTIFEALRALYDRDQPVRATADHLFSEVNRLNPNVSRELIETLIESTEFDLESFDYYKDRLVMDYGKNLITREIIDNTLVETTKKGELDVDKLESFVATTEEVIRRIKGTDRTLKTLPEMLDQYETVISERESGEYKYPTGDAYLDHHLTMGFAPRQISTLFASTGIGKSTYALNLVSKQIHLQIPCMYVSLEMDLVPTMDRLIAVRNHYPIASLYPQGLETTSDEVRSILEKERRVMEKLKHFLFCESALSISDLKYLIRDAKKRMKTEYMVVTVDLLTMLKDFSRGDSSPAFEYEKNMNLLHEIVKEEGVHIFGIVQANREADNTKVSSIDDLSKLKPVFNNIKNSQAIGERSRMVMSAFRAKYYAERLFPDLAKDMDDIMEIDVIKQNMGKVAHLKYRYDGETAIISELKDPPKAEYTKGPEEV